MVKPMDTRLWPTYLSNTTAHIHLPKVNIIRLKSFRQFHSPRNILLPPLGKIKYGILENLISYDAAKGIMETLCLRKDWEKKDVRPNVRL